MKKLLVILFSFLSTYSFAQTAKEKASIDSAYLSWQTQQKGAIGKPLPAFVAKDGKHTLVNENLKGKVVFMNFWFEACYPCIAEFKALNELYEKFKDNKDFVFVSFTFENAKTIKEVRKRYDINYPIYTLKQSDINKLNKETGYPTNIILDKKGNVQFFKSGGSIDQDEATAFVEKEIYPELMKHLNPQAAAATAPK